MSEKMNKNGCSVCDKGIEKYEYFTLAHRPKQKLIQYDYRDEHGNLFSCVKSTLEKCRECRNHWLERNR